MSGKSKQTTGPSKAALPYITSATNAAQSGYDQSSALASSAVNTLQSNLPTVLNQTINNPTLSAANSHTQDVLGGKYLTGNPYLEDQITNTNSSVANKVNGSIGTRGLTGGSAQTQLLASELAKNESGLRYTDYNNERTRMDGAVGSASSLSSAGNQGIATLLQYLTGTAELPQAASNNYANSISSLWGNAQTKTSTPSTMDQIQQGLGLASSAASIFSDRRLKRDIRRVGTEADGLGIYQYRYIWGGPVRTGVMADEVAQIRPWAMGAPESGYNRVNYGAL